MPIRSRCFAPRALTLWLCLAGLLLAGCAHKGPIDRRVVVMDFENNTPSQESAQLAQGLADMMTASLANAPRVTMLERQSMRPLLDDAQNKPGLWVQIGRKADADYMVVGSVARLDQNYVLNARLFSVATGEIVKNSSILRFCTRTEDLYPLIRSMSTVLAWQLKTLAELHDAQAAGRPVTTARPAAARPGAPAGSAQPGPADLAPPADQPIPRIQ